MIKITKIDRTLYFSNGILLTLPILLWNILFASRLPAQFLPDIFGKDIPTVVTYGENSVRLVVFVMPLFFSISTTTRTQKQGVVWYGMGTAVYFCSWLPHFFIPESAWSHSWLGFMAPACTPLLWLIGIGLLGDRFHFPQRYRPIYYIAPAFIFVIFHCTHTAIVHLQNF
jgi:hypothetical protein